MLRILTASLVLFGLWLLLSGHYDPLTLSLGLASSVGVALFAARLDVLPAPTEKALRFVLHSMLTYHPWLAVQIVKSNVDVARRIWKRDMLISPTVVTVPASQKTDLGRAAHANAITLTPGTLSIDARPGEIEVHALATDIATELCKGEMDWRVTRLEKSL